MNRSIVLIGFMGVGKSVVANKLAMKLKRKVVSTDKLIERMTGKSIVDIFRDLGEAYFRRLEESVVEEIATATDLVIDCGGGVVLNQKNIDQLKKNGILFYLSASPEVICKRAMKEPNRPLLKADDPEARIVELLKERKPQYEQADHTIDTSHHNVDQTVSEILKILSHE